MKTFSCVRNSDEITEYLGITLVDVKPLENFKNPRIKFTTIQWNDVNLCLWRINRKSARRAMKGFYIRGTLFWCKYTSKMIKEIGVFCRSWKLVPYARFLFLETYQGSHIHTAVFFTIYSVHIRGFNDNWLQYRFQNRSWFLTLCW